MRKVQGKGINDLYGWSSIKGNPNYSPYKRRVYILWKNMLRRCYNSKYHQQYPSYIGCTVCDEWLYLSNFVRDIKNLPGYQYWLDHPNEKVTLDKDTLVLGNKVYSPKTCQFITLSESVIDSLVRNPRSTQAARESKLYKVKAIYPNGKEVIFNNLQEASDCTGVSKQSICDVIYGRSKKRKGYIFYKL